MSILGYSASYFLPEYWANTPLYGEKIIPLLDYILSNEYEYSDKLAQAFYNITSKYKNTQDLPISQINAIIDESGYSYVRALLGNNEESIRLLVSLVTMIHQLKGTKAGIVAVLNLLRKESNIMTMRVVGTPTIDPVTKDVSKITTTDYITYNNFIANSDSAQVGVKFRLSNLTSNQCILSVADKGFYIGVDTMGRLVLSLSSNRISWDIANNETSNKTLSINTDYYVRLVFDGYEYYLQISMDGKQYSTWITVPSTTSLNITNGTLYLGVDATGLSITSPISGSMNFSDFSVDLDNIEITQWFEQTPVGEEDTFLIKTDLDVELVSSDFFKNFSNFIKNYVYPSLQAFTAYLNFKASLTFLPYVREKVSYVAMSDVNPRANFLVKTQTTSAEATDNFDVLTALGDYIDFTVLIQANVVSTSSSKYVIVEGDVSSLLANNDGVVITGCSEPTNRKKLTIKKITYTSSSNTSKIDVNESLLNGTGGILWKI